MAVAPKTEGAKAESKPRQEEPASAPPSSEIERDGVTKFERSWVLRHAQALTGHQQHIVVGALHGNDQDYFSADEVKSLVEKWLGQKVTTEGGN